MLKKGAGVLFQNLSRKNRVDFLFIEVNNHNAHLTKWSLKGDLKEKKKKREKKEGRRNRNNRAARACLYELELLANARCRGLYLLTT